MSEADIKAETVTRADLMFSKLSAKDGDIIVVTFPQNVEMEQMAAFAHYMEESIPDGVTVFCTKEGVTLEHLPKEQLNALGWYNMKMEGSDTIN